MNSLEAFCRLFPKTRRALHDLDAYAVCVPFRLYETKNLKEQIAIPEDKDGVLLADSAIAPAPYTILLDQTGRPGFYLLRAFHRKSPEWQAAANSFTNLAGVEPDESTHSIVHITSVVVGDDGQPIAYPTVLAFGNHAQSDIRLLKETIETASYEDLAPIVQILLDRVYKAYHSIGIAPERVEVPRDSIRDFLNDMMSAVDAIATTVVTALTLMSCRNVSVEPVEPPPLIRAARRRGDLPEYRYHVLKVRSSGMHGTGGGMGDPVALHFVRAHVKRYTANRPLFGKWTGNWLWVSHYAGRAPRITDKDYEVVT